MKYLLTFNRNLNYKRIYKNRLFSHEPAFSQEDAGFFLQSCFTPYVSTSYEGHLVLFSLKGVSGTCH